FSLVASTWQVIYILFGFTFFFLAASAAICISRLAGAPGVRIIPDLRSDDPRRGFEAFEALVEGYLLAAMSISLSLWLILAHGTFVDSPARNFFEFFYSVAPRQLSVLSLSGPPEMTAALCAFVLLCLSLALPLITLRGAAKRSAADTAHAIAD